MHSVRSILEIPGSNDPVPLRSFGDTIFFNPIYVDVMLALKERPGFIRKTNTLVEGKDNACIMVEILFDSKENCDLYWSDPSIVSLWEYFTLYASESGITVTNEVSSKFLNL